EHQAAGLVHLVDPQPVVRHRRQHGAGRLGARQGNRIPDPDGFRRLLSLGSGADGTRYSKRCKSGNEIQQTWHHALPRLPKSRLQTFLPTLLVGLLIGQAARREAARDSSRNASGQFLRKSAIYLCQNPFSQSPSSTLRLPGPETGGALAAEGSALASV